MTWVFRRPHDYRPAAKTGASLFAILYAAGAMSASESLSFSRNATLTATGTLSGSKSLTFSETGSLFDAGSAPAGGSAPNAFAVTGTLRGTGALAANEALTTPAFATPSSTNAYQPHMRPQKRRPPPVPWDFYGWDARRWTIFPYTVSTATAGLGSLAISGNGSVSATGRLIGADLARFTETGSLVAAGSLLGAKTITFTKNATIGGTASGAISAGRAFGFSESGTLRGAGGMTGPAFLDVSASATYAILVPPSGNEQLAFTARGTMRNASAGAGVVTEIAFATVDGMEIFFSA